MFERAVDVGRIAGHPMSLADALIRQAAALRAAGMREEAAAAIAEAKTTLDACPDPRRPGEATRCPRAVQGPHSARPTGRS